MGCFDPISVLSGRRPATFYVYADARYIDAVIVSQAGVRTNRTSSTATTKRSASTSTTCNPASRAAASMA